MIGDYIEPMIPSAQFIGFTSENNGWLIAAKEKGIGQGGFVLFKTQNGGISWEKTDTELSGTHPFFITGAGFANEDHGFICFNNAVSAADVYETSDGGITWRPKDLLSSLPQKYQTIESLTASSPIFSGSDGIMPMSYFEDGKIIRFYLISRDNGITWEYAE